MEIFDQHEQKIIDFLKSAKELKPSRHVLLRVLDELRVEEARETFARRAPERSFWGFLTDWFSPRYVFAGALVLLVALSAVRLVSPSRIAVASEIAALEIASDEIEGDIEHADVISGEAGVYELDYIANDKK